MEGLRRNRAEARRATRTGGLIGREKPISTGRSIRLKKVPIPDDHPLAFVRDHARKFGTRSAWRTIEAAMIAAEGSDADIDGSDADTGDHAVPARVGLASATCLAANRDGLDPMIAVVYHPDIHGVCTLRELAQVTVVDLPAEARRAPLYWAVPAADAFLVGRAVTEWETLAEVGRSPPLRSRSCSPCIAREGGRLRPMRGRSPLLTGARGPGNHRRSAAWGRKLCPAAGNRSRRDGTGKTGRDRRDGTDGTGQERKGLML